MILLLGGTADTAILATMLAEAGYDVLVSTATGIPLATGDHPRIRRQQFTPPPEVVEASITMNNERSLIRSLSMRRRNKFLRSVVYQ